MRLWARRRGADTGHGSSGDLLIGLAVSFLLWPLALWLLGASIMADRLQSAEASPKPFRPREFDRIDSHSVEEVEEIERVTDPLNAVSELPFGHLNRAWTAFRNSMPDDAKLWSFKSEMLDDMGRKTVREGYAYGTGDGTQHICTLITTIDPSARRPPRIRS